jgi:hypothetical protein
MQLKRVGIDRGIAADETAFKPWKLNMRFHVNLLPPSVIHLSADTITAILQWSSHQSSNIELNSKGGTVDGQGPCRPQSEGEVDMEVGRGRILAI